jgi:hypothetical protein
MRTQSVLTSVFVPLLGALLLTACSVNVKKDTAGEDKNVDINTPFGGIHVNNDADVRDTGLPVYPGAKPKPKGDEAHEKSANVDISTSGFGVKVVAIEYESDDAPSKLMSYYKDSLKKYGKVLECRTDSGGYDYHGGDSDELKCEGSNSGKKIELKAGTRSNQHIVSIEPQGKGADFALVYVRTRGKEGTI